MIQLTISGKERSRLRVHLGFFWIVGPWKEKNFKWGQSIPFDGFNAQVGPFHVNMSHAYGRVTLQLSTMGIPLWGGTVDVPEGGISLPFRSAPIKGVTYEGSVRVEVK